MLVVLLRGVYIARVVSFFALGSVLQAANMDQQKAVDKKHEQLQKRGINKIFPFYLLPLFLAYPLLLSLALKIC
jgi:hypothetical protein